MKTMRALASAVLSLAVIFAALPVVPAFAHEAGTDEASAPGANALSAAQQPQGANAGAELSRGKSLLRRGRAAQALVHLENALRLYTQANNDQGSAAANDALGELYEQQGQYAVALARYQSAHEAFARAAARRSAAANFVGLNNDEYNAKLALAKIGHMHARRGDAAAARAAYAQMNATRPDTGSVSPVRRRGGLFGAVAGAATGAALGGVTGGAAAGAAVGAALAIGQAFGVYRQSIIYATHEIGLGRLSYQGGQFDAAKRHFENALASSDIAIISSFGQSRRFRVAARTGLGDVAFRQGRQQDAVRLYGEAANGARSDNRLDLQWPAQRGLGRARYALAAQERNERRAGQLREESLTAYRDALRTIETIRAGSLRADEARTTFVATTKDVFDEAAGALAEMALLAAGANAAAPLQGRALEYASESFKITEQGRARSLLEMLGEVGAEITEGVPAELLQRRQQNLERQEDLAQELSGVTTGTDEPRRPVGEVETELDRLQTELDSIENQIRAASPRYATLTAPQPLALTEVQQRVLDEQTVLLAYSLGQERSYLWAVGRDSVTLHRLPARERIEQQAAEFRQQIVPAQQARSILSAETQRGLGLGAPTATGAATTAQPAANVAPFAAAAHTLYQTIIAPAAAQLGERRLLIVPDGALNYIPFAALVAAPGGADYTALSYLVKTNEVVYAPSASVVAAVRAQRQAAPAASGGILLIADPVFDQSDPRARGAAGAQTGAQAGSEVTRGLGLGSAVADVAGVPQAAAGGNAPEVRLARLQGARVEAEQIAQLARTTNRQPSTWLDLEANETNLKTRDLRNYRVIHVATHGLLNTERPQFTGLVFSLVGNREDDGFLRTDEVFNLRLGAPLVMLSACETGLGRERRGEGVMGLTRAFMYAGAPTVGVTLWAVVDRSTAELMTDFYRRHLAAESAPAPAALRAAQQSMIANQRYSAPRYWAPFTLVGDWR